MALDRFQLGFSFKRTLLALSVGVFSTSGVADIFENESPSEIQTDDSGEHRRKGTEKGYDQPVRGETRYVTAEDEAISYQVSDRGVLNALPGSHLKDVSISASNFNADGSQVLGAVVVTSGEANVKNSKIKNVDGTAVSLLFVESDPLAISRMHIEDSEVSGAAHGVAVGTTSELWLKNSTLQSSGSSGKINYSGLRLSGGVAHATANTKIQGKDNGVYIVNGSFGYAPQINLLELNGSSVSGETGSAIKIDKNSSARQPNTVARINIANGSTLAAGNGRLIDVLNKSTVDVDVSNSILSGDMVADDTSQLNVTLQNHARLDGNIINGNSVIIDSSGRWQLGANNKVQSLAIDGGSVGFSEDSFHSLTLGQLSGRGRFDMRIDIANGTGDFLNVEGQANGKYLLNVRNTGQETVPAEFESLQLVHTEGGDAQFRLRGARADFGAYSYSLEQQGNDWYIIGSGKTISPSTQSALALFNVGPTIWNSELSTLRSRMGEVRGREQGGGWMRGYGSRFKASMDSGLSYQQRQHGLSFGADAPVPVSGGQLLVGLMGGYSQSALDMGRGTSGEVDSYYVGAYGTWLSDEGYYLDGVVKVNKFHNASKVAMSDGEKAKGDYSNMAVGGSVEFGKHIKLPDDYFVEPFAQLSSVWIGGDSYTLDNGLKANTAQTQSVVGKVGTTLGRQFTLKEGGVVQPYVRVAAAHEFSRGNDVSVNDQRFDNDLFGSRAELGAGVSVSLSKRLQVHADFDYMKGQHVEQPWGANLGLRLAF